MQNVIYSVKHGVIKNIFIKENDVVQADDRLIELE
jgi:biotin carboxyl carrier protein